MADALDLLIARGPPPQDFSALGDIPKSYWEGLTQRHVQDLRDAFKGGVPTTPDGSIDYGAMQKTLYQKGGLQEGTAFGNLDMNRLGIEALNRVEGGQPGQSGAVSRPIVSPATSRDTASAQPQPQSGYKGGDSGTGTVASLVPPDHPQAGVIIGNIARSVGADPNAPLNPDQMTRATALLNAYTARSGAPGGAVPVPQGPPAQVAQAAPQAAPAPPQPGAYGPAATAESRGSVPTANDPEIQDKIRQLTILAGSPNPSVAKAAQLRLQGLQKQAELTNAQKEYDLARRQGFRGSFDEYQAKTEADKAYATKNVETYIKRYEGIQTAGDRARDEIPKLELARKLTDDPNFYSGVGEKYNLLLKRAVGALGGDPNISVPQEGFRKIVSDSILDQIKSMTGTGPVRVAEMKIMQDAAASPDNSPQANRMLIEIATRLNRRAAEVGTMAQNYNGGRLDAGFDRRVSQFRDANPLFTPAETADFRKIIAAGGKPQPAPAETTPASLQTFKTPADVRAAGLKSGTRFLDANGVERMVP